MPDTGQLPSLTLPSNSLSWRHYRETIERGRDGVASELADLDRPQGFSPDVLEARRAMLTSQVDHFERCLADVDLMIVHTDAVTAEPELGPPELRDRVERALADGIEVDATPRKGGKR